jgi:hypothetical protein
MFSLYKIHHPLCRRFQSAPTGCISRPFHCLLKMQQGKRVVSLAVAFFLLFIQIAMIE